jgi:hypothetical protein
MNAGNVMNAPLADIVGTVTQMAATLPARMRACEPDRCFPDWKPCQPERTSGPAGMTTQGRPPCMPDHYCNPTCSPGACKPNI